MRSIYRRNYKGFDILVTEIASLITTIVVVHYAVLSDINEDLILTLTEAFIGLLGLIMALMAVIFSFNNSKKLKYFKESSNFTSVADIFINAIVWTTIAISVLVVLIQLDLGFSVATKFWLLSWSTLLIVVKIARCVWLVRELFRLSVD